MLIKKKNRECQLEERFSHTWTTKIKPHSDLRNREWEIERGGKREKEKKKQWNSEKVNVERKNKIVIKCGKILLWERERERAHMSMRLLLQSRSWFFVVGPHMSFVSSPILASGFWKVQILNWNSFSLWLGWNCVLEFLIIESVFFFF